MRYQNTPQKINKENQRVLRPILYPPIPKKSTDIYIYTTVGDRLDNLAHAYYGDVNLWWILAEANGVGKGTFSLESGVLFRIPKQYEDILTEYDLINNSYNN